MRPEIGIAIATFNSERVIERCLRSLAGGQFTIVLFDDGSSDSTVARARAVCPDLILMRGDGNNWWAGSTAAAVARALELGCDHVVLLNPDVELAAGDVRELVAFVERNPLTIAAPVVVDRDDPSQIAWAGSRFGRLGKLPIYTSRYVRKRGEPVSLLGTSPYDVDEVHGRGTVLSRSVIARIGMFDTAVFPHYGADSDLSLRARRQGVRLAILPAVRARLAVEHSGMAFTARSPRSRVRALGRYLFDRKSGEGVRVWWNLMVRHVPPGAVLPSFAFNILLNVARRLR
jgi:GT2 family glycosyltransferase